MIQTDGTAPYAPPKSVMEVIRKFRDKGLQTPIDLGVLDRAGISSALAPRVLQALRLLDLIDSTGNPTQAFEKLRKVSTGEFEGVLAEVVRSAYAEVFNFVDPAEDSIDAISDAFRSYTPPGQRSRMVTLFVGLCQEAGIIKSKPAPRTSGNGRATRPSERVHRQPEKRGPRRRDSSSDHGELPPQLAGLLKTLPAPDEGWTSSRRDQFIAAFRAILDYTYQIREALPSASDAEPEGGDK